MKLLKIRENSITGYKTSKITTDVVIQIPWFCVTLLPSWTATLPPNQLLSFTLTHIDGSENLNLLLAL